MERGFCFRRAPSGNKLFETAEILQKDFFQWSQNLEGCLLADPTIHRVLYKFPKSFDGRLRVATQFNFHHIC